MYRIHLAPLGSVITRHGNPLQQPLGEQQPMAVGELTATLRAVGQLGPALVADHVALVALVDGGTSRDRVADGTLEILLQIIDGDGRQPVR